MRGCHQVKQVVRLMCARRVWKDTGLHARVVCWSVLPTFVHVKCDGLFAVPLFVESTWGSKLLLFQQQSNRMLAADPTYIQVPRIVDTVVYRHQKLWILLFFQPSLARLLPR